MAEQQTRECDLDDILCQMQALSYLKGLQRVLGKETFRSRFPELQGLDEKLAERIKGQESSLRELMKKFGLPVLTGAELVEGTESENIDEE